MLFKKKLPSYANSLLSDETFSRQAREFMITDEEEIVKVCNFIDNKHKVGGWLSYYNLWKYIKKILPETMGDSSRWELQLCGGKGIRVVEKVEE